MAHEVNERGSPIDPKLSNLQAKLKDLAAQLRSVRQGIARQVEIVNEYHAVMAELYQLGWDAIPPVDFRLPVLLMPDEYRKRHPLFRPPHEVDESRYPIDPKLRGLQHKLGYLAMEFRGVARGIEGTWDIVKDYHDVMAELYQLGWDDMLDIEDELPDHVMPEEYQKGERVGSRPTKSIKRGIQPTHECASYTSNSEI